MKTARRRREMQFRREFYERVVRHDPQYQEALAGLAQVCTELGDYQKGLQADLCLARLSPLDPAIYYNLACDYSRLGRIDEAFVLLRAAVLLGYRDRERMDRDPDLENLRKDRRYREVQRELGACG